MSHHFVDKPGHPLALRLALGIGILGVSLGLACGGGSRSSGPGTPAPVTPSPQTSSFVYVANTGGGVSAFALDDGTGALVEMADSPYDNGTPSMHVVSDPLGRFLISVNNDGNYDSDDQSVTVYPIDPASGALQADKATVAPTPVGPWCAAVTPPGKYVYVRCETTIAAYSLDGATGALTHLADTPTSTGHGDLVIHPSGKYLFAAANVADALDVFGINATNGALTRIGDPIKMPAGTGPIGVALSNKGLNLFVKGEASSADPSNAVYGYTIDPGTGALAPMGAVVSNIPSADSYHGLTFNPTLNVLHTAYSSCDQNFGAYALNPSTGAMTSIADYAWEPDAGTDNIALSPSGKWFFATNYNSDEITLGAVNTTTGALTLVGTEPVGSFPVSVTVVNSVK